MLKYTKRSHIPALFVCMVLLSLLVTSLLSARETVRHVIVSYAPEEFAGWPANHGMWIWENEILVGYILGEYMFRDSNHSINPDLPMEVAFSRSTDGGLTWTRESSYHAIRFRNSNVQNIEDAKPVDFTSPDFAWKLRYDSFHFSDDRGKSWNGPFKLPEFEDPNMVARTNYIVTGKESALAFLTSSPREHSTRTGRGRSFVAETRDGGRSFEFLSWIGPDPGEGLPDSELPAFSTMPAAVQIGPDHFVCALRQRVNRRKWTDVFESRDHGRTWEHISVLEKGSTNPAALVHLGKKRVAAIYGWRGRPFGIRAKLSKDGGRTWGDEIILRDDAATWDIGYTRAVVRPDGVVVITYYYATEERPEQHIAATLWKPKF